MKTREEYLLSQLKYNEAHRMERRALAVKWRIKNKDRKKEYDREYYKKYMGLKDAKLKANIRSKLRYEVRVGRVKKMSCEKCGDKKSQAHHKDYSKPLDVVWLCRKHHENLHHS